MIRNDNPDKGTETIPVSHAPKLSKIQIRNDNPDKGTETQDRNLALLLIYEIRNATPDKGTETLLSLMMLHLLFMIRNDNPDKGTETWHTMHGSFQTYQRLEMITPIRGRKHRELYKCTIVHFWIRNTTPIRGRKYPK